MNMRIAFVTNLEPSKRVKPRDRTLDWPTRFSKPTAMRRADFCEHWRDASLAQAPPMGFGTVAPVALNDLRLVQGTAPLAPDVWNGIDQRIKLGNVVPVRRAQDDRERDALRVDDEVVFAAELASVRGFGPVFFPPARRESMSCRRAHARNRFRHGDAVRPATFRGCVARHPLLATRRAVASKLCPNHIPFPVVEGSTQCPSATRRLCPLARRGRVSVGGPHTGDCAVLALAAGVR
ncbi:hypothetical protein B0G80_5578 [Paraburkholderia sp. BL6669N2]|nr:hypothetical protein B0G80_5578 [Paraburkholderia sp. BL6669N2]